MKQSKLRRRRVIRYAILYFVMLVDFVGLIVGPIVAAKFIPKDVINNLLGDMKLVQPTGLNNDNTRGDEPTGTGRPGYDGVGTKTQTADGTPEETASPEEDTNSEDAKLRFF
jgi:1,3-beta-glucan synthase